MSNENVTFRPASSDDVGLFLPSLKHHAESRKQLPPVPERRAAGQADDPPSDRPRARRAAGALKRHTTIKNRTRAILYSPLICSHASPKSR